MQNLAVRREQLRAGNPHNKITAIVDNMIFIEETKDVIKWDDENEIVYVYKPNEDHRDPARPLKVQTFDYADIQCLEVDTDKNGINDIIEVCGFDKEAADEMTKKLTTIDLKQNRYEDYIK